MKEAHVTVVSDLASLGALENDWRAMHCADPHATVFTSWLWLLGRLSALAEPWQVLVARDEEGGQVMGLLPLRRPAMDAGEEPVLAMAGSPWADYTGFLCRPGRDEAALAALAGHLRGRPDWSRLELRDVFDPRLAAFLAHFAPPAFTATRLAPTPCPRVELAPTWDAFLATRVRPRRRQTLRRQLRALESLPGLRITTLADGAEAQLACLLELWQGRWGKRPEAELAELRAIFRSCLPAGLVWLDILWQDEKALAGLLAFLDRDRGQFRFYISGCDPVETDRAAGIGMVAHSLRAAIALGFRGYDFLRGDEPYKHSFGARTAEIDNVDVVRRGEAPT